MYPTNHLFWWLVHVHVTWSGLRRDDFLSVNATAASKSLVACATNDEHGREEG